MDKNRQILLPNYFSFIKNKSFIEPSLIGSNIYFGYNLFSKNTLKSICGDQFQSLSQNHAVFFPVFYDLIKNDLLKKNFIYKKKDENQSILEIEGIGEILAYDLKKLQDEINFLESNNEDMLKIFQDYEIVEFLQILQNENILKLFNKPEIFNDWAFNQDTHPDWTENINWFKTNYSSLFYKFFKYENDFDQEKMKEAVVFIKLKCDVPEKIRNFLESLPIKYGFDKAFALKEIIENRDNIFDSLILFLNNENLRKIASRKEILEIISDKQRFSYLVIASRNIHKFKKLLNDKRFKALISDNEINLFFRKFPEFQLYFQNQYDKFYKRIKR